MDGQSNDLLAAIHEIRDLIRLMAEPAIAQRDKKYRNELRQIVGKSAPRAKSVLLMDGTRTQKNIIDETRIHKGELSGLVKKLKESKLVIGDGKQPQLVITIPNTFFDSDSDNDDD
jgi:hypothetical protein